MNFNILSCCSCWPYPFLLPWPYEFIDVLGESGFGTVLRCQKKDTEEIVAIKVPKCTNNRKELAMMERLRSFNLHQHNVVKFLDSFPKLIGDALVMELLDCNLFDYLMKTWDKIMPLSDIRAIIQQMATALEALKNIGVIHTDIKPHNIMTVDRRTRPFGVKLIDFGLAIHTHTAKAGMRLQPLSFRAPEIILGLPFTEAIDMWALGCVMTFMLTKALLFQGQNENEVLQCIVFHLGQPADHLLDEGLHTDRFFIRTESNSWKLKEDLSPDNPSSNYVDKLREERLDKKNAAEASEAKECIDLLLAMLEVNPTKRISPAEVLAHPFIRDATNIQPAHHNPSPTIPPSHVIYVQPAPAENTLRLEDEECALSLQTQVNKASRHVSWTTANREPPATAPKDNDTTNVQSTHHSSSPIIPRSRVIYVQPATAENTRQLEDEECALDLQAAENDSTVTENDCGVTESDPKTFTPEDSGTCGQKKKRKKNCSRCLRDLR